MLTTYRGFYWVSMNYNKVFGITKFPVMSLFQIPFKGKFVKLFKLQWNNKKRYNLRKLKKLSKYTELRYEDHEGNEKKWDYKSQYNEIYVFDLIGRYIGTPEDAISYYKKMRVAVKVANNNFNYGEIDL